MEKISTWIWLIPVLPLLAALLTAAAGPHFLRKHSHLPVIIALAVSAILAVVVLGITYGTPEVPQTDINGYNWLSIDNLQSTFKARISPLTTLMLVTVLLVSLVVTIYSKGYMAGERGYGRFFAFIGLFVFSMLMLVISDNFLMLYIFWEAVGLCSYLLIGFWYQRPEAAAAAKKAFIVNRIGDFGFAVGILLIFLNFNTVEFYGSQGVFTQAHCFAAQHPVLITVIALCLFAGAVGKSAQLPLYVWLPDAMEGPTPVSALIHAATMVTAGVYMVARCGAIFSESKIALTVVAITGGITALFATVIALVQTDIKRILAYSTISQLGYMFLAVGVGSAAAGIFHLYTHAFFKALLFLAAGAIMHAMHNHIDLKELGGLKNDIPWARWTFLIGALALAGFPGLAGFFSKDEILWGALNHPTLFWLGWIGVFTAALTAFYIFRCYFLAFHGPRLVPKDVAQPHETPVMSYCLVVLAVGSILAGYINWGKNHPLDSFLSGSVSLASYHRLDLSSHRISHDTVMYISIAAALLGIAAAGLICLPTRTKADQIAAYPTLRPMHKLLLNKFYVDEIYQSIFVHPLRFLGKICFTLDNLVIDSLIWLITVVPRAAGAVVGLAQRGSLQTYALLMILGLTLTLILVIYAI